MSQDIVAVNGSNKPALVRPVATPTDLIDLHKEVSKLINESLEAGIDYGVVPGTGSKPSLLKPGAERLALAFGAHPEYTPVASEVDHDRLITYTKRKKRWLNRHKNDREWEWEEAPGESRGLYRYIYECKLVRHDGRVLGTGQGVCSTMESKYVDRPRDCENTVLKMAQKRAFIAATLNAFGLSNRFTQDVEDMYEQVPAAAPASEAPAAPPPTTTAAQPAASKKPLVYLRTDAQVAWMREFYDKRNVPSEIWEEIDRALYEKPFTELAAIVAAARNRFDDFIASKAAAEPAIDDAPPAVDEAAP